MDLIRSRQSELVDSNILPQPITIIGCGGIGSFTALTLAKMGFTDITVYDFDAVSPENISNQFYRYSDIGTNKAEALRHMILDFEQLTITAQPIRWTKEHSLTQTVIMAVDSMTVRKSIYDQIKSNRGIKRFIDGRMGGQQAEVYAVENVPTQRAIYEQYLWSEQEASDLPCTQKAVMYNVLWIASYISNTLRLMLEQKAYHHVSYMDFHNSALSTVNH